MDFEKLIAARNAKRASIVAQREALGTEASAIIAAAEADNARSLTAKEDARSLEIVGQRASLGEELRGIDKEIEQLRAAQAEDEAEQRAAEHGTSTGAAAPAARITDQPATYRKGGQNSFFRDLYRAEMRGDTASRERLGVHMKERAISTADGAGGEFVPPLWMVDDYIAKARAGRVVANQLELHDLPGGTDSISLPRVATGTTASGQAGGQNTALSETDLTTDKVTADVTTKGGVQTVAVQLIEQSPINIDEIVIGDLAAELAVEIDKFAISANATNQTGLMNVSGLNAVTFTNASPTVDLLLPKLIDGASRIHTGRFLPAQKVFMTPAMWAWIVASQDGQKRPLVVPNAFGPNNAQGLSEGAVAEGFAGTLTGLALPVYIDANMPSNLGAGTNESHALVARTSDIHLFESSAKAGVFYETAAKNLSVVFRLYQYVAIHASRLPKSISKIAGTGTIVPAL